MANFYSDNPNLKFHLNHPLMEKIVRLKERNYTEKEKHDFAALDLEDALDSYDKVLEIVGEISGDIIAPNAESVDHEGLYHQQRSGICTGNPRELRCTGKIRHDWYVTAPGIRWIKLPYGALRYGR
ncbi:hypothetical protein MASR1M74_03990 [Lentimicrobium sp.]